MAKKKPQKATKKSLAQRMREKKEELKNRGSKSSILRQKEEGTIRVRVLPTGEENDFVLEIMTFWLGKDAGSVVSPQTFGEPCAIFEKFKELKNSDDEDDRELAKKLVPRNKFVLPILMYKDLKGKKIDKENSGKLLQITNGLCQEIIDLYLDEDDWGDMTDAKNGYDLKITRDGLKLTDTNYTVAPCKNTPIDKAYKKPIDLEALVKEEVDSYEETLRKLNIFLNSAPGEDDDDDAPKKKKKKGKKVKKKKRKKDA